jgi:hypothetical protein
LNSIDAFGGFLLLQALVEPMAGGFVRSGLPSSQDR